MWWVPGVKVFAVRMDRPRCSTAWTRVVLATTVRGPRPYRPYFSYAANCRSVAFGTSAWAVDRRRAPAGWSTESENTRLVTGVWGLDVRTTQPSSW